MIYINCTPYTLYIIHCITFETVRTLFNFVRNCSKKNCVYNVHCTCTLQCTVFTLVHWLHLKHHKMSLEFKILEYACQILPVQAVRYYNM